MRRREQEAQQIIRTPKIKQSFPETELRKGGKRVRSQLSEVMFQKLISSNAFNWREKNHEKK